MKNEKKNNWGLSGNMSYKDAKSLAHAGPLKQRTPAQFTNGQRNSGPYSPQAEAARKQAQTNKQTTRKMSKMQDGLKQTVDNLDITGAQKAKIFDTIEPKKNGPQRGKLGY